MRFVDKSAIFSRNSKLVCAERRTGLPDMRRASRDAAGEPGLAGAGWMLERCVGQAKRAAVCLSERSAPLARLPRTDILTSRQRDRSRQSRQAVSRRPTMERLAGRQQLTANARVLCGTAYPAVRRRSPSSLWYEFMNVQSTSFMDDHTIFVSFYKTVSHAGPPSSPPCDGPTDA